MEAHLLMVAEYIVYIVYKKKKKIAPLKFKATSDLEFF